MIKSEHRVQHSPSAAYIEYCIHCILHRPNMDCLPLPASLSSLGRTCCTQVCTFPQLWVNKSVESQLPSHLTPELPTPVWPPPSPPPILQDCGLQVHLQTRSMPASKCTSKLTLSQPPRVFPNLHNYGLQVGMITTSKCISILAQSPPQRVSPNSHNYGLEVRIIKASKYLSKFPQPRRQSVSLSSLDYGMVK